MVEAFDLTYKIRLKDISDFNRISHGIHSYHRKKQFPPKSHPINPVNPENKKSSLWSSHFYFLNLKCLFYILIERSMEFLFGRCRTTPV